MKHGTLSFLAVAGLLVAAGVAGSLAPARGSIPDPGKVVKFSEMVGIPPEFTGDESPIRGVSGGGLPWVITSGKGELRTDGELQVKVRGLVLDPDDPAVIERGLAGVNPIPSFKAIVSCISLDAEGNPVVVNRETDLFPADEEGDCSIRDRVELPFPCIAPVVFVTSPGGMWFAATGF